jgi:lipoprotein NlpI
MLVTLLRLAVPLALAAVACAQDDSPRTLVERGMSRFVAGDVRGSLEDFDRAAELEPRIAPHLWQRGISLYYVGEYQQGAEQFELHQTVNPSDVENGAWHFLCLAKAKGVEEARENTLPIGRDGRVPMAEVWRLFRGEGGVEEVMAAAQRDGSADALLYGRLYLALYYAALGDRAKELEHSLAAATDAPSHYMGSVARVHARHLQAQQ